MVQRSIDNIPRFWMLELPRYPTPQTDKIHSNLFQSEPNYFQPPENYSSVKSSYRLSSIQINQSLKINNSNRGLTAVDQRKLFQDLNLVQMSLLKSIISKQQT